MPSQAHADLLMKLRTGVPFAFGADRWMCFPVQGDFNQTADKAFWDGATDGWPLWKGGSFDTFDPRGTDARICPASEAALKKARKPRPGSGSLIAESVDVKVRREAVARTVGRARVAFRDVTRATDSRTVRACLVPPECFLTHKAPYLAFIEENPRSEAACLAMMSSLAFDFQARRYVEVSLAFFILEGLRLPTFDDEIFDALASAAARLSCADERFLEFAAVTGVECGPLSDEKRVELRVEIDACAAHAWDLTTDELELVFSDFTLDAVPETYREFVRARFSELM